MRLINADEIRKKAVPHTRGEYGYSADIRKWAVLVGEIDDAPTIDAVPVVRCKDCKHSGMYSFGCGDNEKLACLEVEEDGFVRFATAVDANGYCSCGERRADHD